MTDVDREMLKDIYWTLMILKWICAVIGFYYGWRLVAWWEEGNK